MNVNWDKDGKWKHRLLSSGLPLEHIAMRLLGEQHFLNCGPYSYRIGAKDDEKAGSVDIHGFRILKEIPESQGGFDLLVECKYSNPSVRWVFCSLTGYQSTLAEPFFYFDELSEHKIERDRLDKYAGSWRCCGRGAAISSDSSDDRQISHGLEQLRYGCISRCSGIFMRTAAALRKDTSYVLAGHGVTMCLPVLVTNAELWILRRRIDLKVIYTSQSLKDIADKVDYLVCFEKAGPEKNRFCFEEMRKLKNAYPQTDQFLEGAMKRLDERGIAHHPYKGISDMLGIMQAKMEDSTEKIAVVSLSAFKRWLGDLAKAKPQ